MAYSKTTWANGTTPAINAANLNKIEQGIYDLSLESTNLGNSINKCNEQLFLRTYNLVDSHDALFWEQGLIPYDANYQAWCIHTVKLYLKKNTTYTFITNKTTHGTFRRLRLHKSDGTLLDTINLGSVASDTYYQFTIDASTYPTFSYAYLYWGPFTGTYTPSDLVSDNIDMMIYEGSGTKLYVPYYENNSATQEKENENLFDQTTYTAGVLYSNGSIVAADNWRTTDLIKLRDNTSIIYAHFGYPAFRYAFYNANSQIMSATYVSETSFGTKITPNENAKYIRFSYVNDGTSAYDYVHQYISYIDRYDVYGGDYLAINSLIEKEINKSIGNPSIRIVNWTGEARYKTISSAVDESMNGDIIIVMPGTYNETVQPKNKNVTIIGIDKSTCILQNNYADYDRPPLYMTNGVVKNLTIKCLSNGTTPGRMPYCIHIDIAFSGIYKEMVVENCSFISDYGDCLGCGTRDGHKLVVKNCDFENSSNSARFPFAYHNTTSPSNAEVRIENCHLINKGSGSYCVYFFDYTAAQSLVSVELINNTAKSVVNGVSDANFVLNAQGTNKFTLENTSHGNNIGSMNYSNG